MLLDNSPPIQLMPTEVCGQEAPRRWSFAWQSIPGWLVSLLVHLGFLLLLAGFSNQLGLPGIRTLVVEGSMGDGETGDFEIASAASSEMLAPELIVPESSSLQITELTVADLTVNLETVGMEPAARIASLTRVLQAGMGTDTDSMSNSSDALSGLKNGIEFFGLKAVGKRFVFVVDSSNSMRGGRFVDAKKELLATIKRLSADQSFYVLFFDQDAARMTFAPDKEPVPGLVAATKENIYKLENWVETVENERQTNPLEAMKFAVAMLPDVIYLLSDGKFTDRGGTLEFLQIGDQFKEAKKLKRPKVVIHTLGFYGRDSEVTLKQISDAYKGIYRFVPDPRRSN